MLINEILQNAFSRENVKKIEYLNEAEVKNIFFLATSRNVLIEMVQRMLE